MSEELKAEKVMERPYLEECVQQKEKSIDGGLLKWVAEYALYLETNTDKLVEAAEEAEKALDIYRNPNLHARKGEDPKLAYERAEPARIALKKTRNALQAFKEGDG